MTTPAAFALPRMKRYFEPASGDPQCSKEALAMYKDPSKRTLYDVFWNCSHFFNTCPGMGNFTLSGLYGILFIVSIGELIYEYRV